jgi:hypothetical protein
VKDAIKKHANLESSPTRLHQGTTYEKIMNLRPRDKSSEIDGDFRYQAKSNVEKVLDKIKNRNAMGSTKTDELITNKFTASHQKGLVLKKNLDLS